MPRLTARLDCQARLHNSIAGLDRRPSRWGCQGDVVRQIALVGLRADLAGVAALKR
jgi:hypothetical protein